MSQDQHSEDNRAIIHVDMDAFYASVEILDDPTLAGKPVIVGGTPEGRGVVSAASYEARRFGIHSAMSAFRARKLCPNAGFIRPRMWRYVELSERIRRIFEEFTPLVEPISLDEAFLDVTGSRRLFGPAEEIGREIKRRIRDEVGLIASVGVAPNKFLAKLASDLEKPDGFVVVTHEGAEALLAPLPVSRLWGVGKKSQEVLAGLGVHTVGDVVRMPYEQLEARMGSYAGRLKDLARGIDDRPVVVDGEAKSIGAETTFPEDIGDAERLRGHLDSLVERVARRLRKKASLARTVHLKARFADFTTVTRAVTLAEPTERTQDIRDAARDLLERRLDRRNRPLRLIGVSVSNLTRSEDGQHSLFADRESDKEKRVDRIMDDLHDKYGSDVIRRGRGRKKESEF
jgi:DNA polymerase-4